MPAAQGPDATEYDVIVAGAGMVGAALTIALAREGLHVCAVDRSVPASFDPTRPPHIRVSSLNLASEALLSRLGAWPGIVAARLQTYRRLAVWESGPTGESLSARLARAGRVEFCAGDIDHSHLGHIVENDVIQRSLLDCLATTPGAELHIGSAVSSLETKDGRQELTLEDGSRMVAKLVVGADGALSRIREQAGLGLRVDPYDQKAMVIAIRHAAPASDITWQAFTPHGPLAYLPLPMVGQHAYASLVWYDQPARIDALMALDEDTLLEQIKTAFPSELPTPLAITARGQFPLRKSHARRYWRPGVALAGDAAHTINPLAGQGLNLGLQDVEALAEALAATGKRDAARGYPEALNQYERKRRLDNLTMMTAMDAFYYTFSNDHTPLRILRSLGLGLAQRLGPARRKVVAYATGLHALDAHEAARSG